jgi:hypothetical protein
MTGARIHLYKCLDKLQDRVFYFDKDSILYVQKESEYPPIEPGDYLGDITNELKTGEYIDEFASGVPKNYAYRVCRLHTSQVPKMFVKIAG